MDSFLYHVHQFVLDSQLIDHNQPIIMAFSGGPDSECLLAYLQKSMTSQIHCVYCSHQLRDDRAERRRVNQLLSSQIIDIDVENEAKKLGISIETAGRQLRYHKLVTVAQSMGINQICTAHHADDHLESLLMQLIRGTKSNFNGIKSKQLIDESWSQLVSSNTASEMGSITLIRPLLCVSKNQIVQYLNQSNAPYITDPTNTDRRYTRNKVRHDLIPILRDINPNVLERFDSFAKYVNQATDFIREQAQPIIQSIDIDTHCASIDTRSVKALHPVVQSQVLYHLVQSKMKPQQSVSTIQINQVIGLLQTRVTKYVDLPGQLRVSVDQQKIRVMDLN